MNESIPVYGEFGRWPNEKFVTDLVTAHDLGGKLILFDAHLLFGYICFVMARAGYSLKEIGLIDKWKVKEQKTTSFTKDNWINFLLGLEVVPWVIYRERPVRVAIPCSLGARYSAKADVSEILLEIVFNWEMRYIETKSAPGVAKNTAGYIQERLWKLYPDLAKRRLVLFDPRLNVHNTITVVKEAKIEASSILSAEELAQHFIEEPAHVEKVESEWGAIRDKAIADFSHQYPVLRWFIVRCLDSEKIRLTGEELLDARQLINHGKFREALSKTGTAIERLVYVICQRESRDFRKLLQENKKMIMEEFSENFYNDLHLIYNWRLCGHPEYVAPRPFRNPTLVNAHEVMDRAWTCYNMFQVKSYDESVRA